MRGVAQAERPIRDLLGGLTVEANDRQLDPFETYIRFCEEMGHLGLIAADYCSSSITSGGHARDNSLSVGEVIAKNTDTAMDICDELFTGGQLNPKTAVEAVTLGKIRPWCQSDYMTFWLSTMAGLPSRGSGVLHTIREFQRRFEAAQRANTTLDMDIYNSTQPAAERAPHYFTHAQVFSSVALQHQTSPVHRLVRLVDPDMSLGAQTENVFARLMGTGVFRVAIAETGIEASPQSLSPRLLQDTQHLVRFGATVFDTERKQQLVLVPQV
jgi:hypothetical protein